MQNLARKGRGAVFNSESSIERLPKPEGQFLKLNHANSGYERQRGRFES